MQDDLTHLLNSIMIWYRQSSSFYRKARNMGWALLGTVLDWLRSYLTSRDYFVSLGEFCSDRVNISCGVKVPQGWVQALILFCLYMLPLSSIIGKHEIGFSTDMLTTHNSMSASVDDISPVGNFVSCISEKTDWMAQNVPNYYVFNVLIFIFPFVKLYILYEMSYVIKLHYYYCYCDSNSREALTYC